MPPYSFGVAARSSPDGSRGFLPRRQRGNGVDGQGNPTGRQAEPRGRRGVRDDRLGGAGCHLTETHERSLFGYKMVGLVAGGGVVGVGLQRAPGGGSASNGSAQLARRR